MSKCLNQKCCPQRNGECGVWGCLGCSSGVAHYCTKCGKNPSDHRACHCPSIANCGVPGCNACPPGAKHWCKFCKMQPSNHRSANCPSMKPKAAITSSSSTNAKIVCVYLVNKDKQLLIHKRSMGVSNGGGYSTPGGSIDAGELPTTAAVRELREEAGVNIAESELVQFSVKNGFIAFYASVPNNIKVSGPDSKHRWEVDMNANIASEIVGATVIPNTGHAWISLNSFTSRYPFVNGYVATLRKIFN